MAENSDLRDHALSSKLDFYELLGVAPTSTDSELRRAYRKTALKYHPDKVGPDPVAAEKFHALQIAYDVLSDDTARQLYDNARRAREEKKERDAAYEGRRKNLKEELERREREGVAGLKRKRDHTQEADEALQREITRLAADGARRRKEREEQLRRELQEDLEREQRENGTTQHASATKATVVTEMDRSIKLRYPADGGLDQEHLREKFSRFGNIQDVVLKNKKVKIEGEKHRKEYTIAMIVFESIVGAHAAVNHDYGTEGWTTFDSVDWAAGKEPDCVLKSQLAPAQAIPDAAAPKKPTFSFKAPPTAGSGVSAEDHMMMRLKNAEKKRQERLAARGVQ